MQALTLESPILSTVVISSIILLSTLYYRVADYDLFARLSVGKLYFSLGSIPRVDTFAYTPTLPEWIDHEWLAGIVFYVTSMWRGDTALFILNFAAAFGTVLCLVKAQRALGGSSKTGFTLLFFAVLPSSFVWNNVIRSQAFTFLLFALLVLLVTRAISGSRFALLSIPFLFVPWINLHAGFVAGLGFLGLAALSQALARAPHAVSLSAVTVASALTALINPYGPRFVGKVIGGISMPRPDIGEWGPLPLSMANLAYYVTAALVVAVFVSASRARVPRWSRAFVFISFIVGFSHHRLIPFALFSTAVFFPAAVTELAERLSRPARARLEAFFDSVALLATSLPLGAIIWLVAIYASGQGLALDRSAYPVEATAWLVNNTEGGRVLTHFNHGSYVLFHGEPKCKVAIDGRYEEVYPDSTFVNARDSLNPSSPNFVSAFNAIRPDYVILCGSTTPLAVARQLPGEWRALFTESSGHCAVFAESAAAHSPRA